MKIVLFRVTHTPTNTSSIHTQCRTDRQTDSALILNFSLFVALWWCARARSNELMIFWNCICALALLIVCRFKSNGKKSAFSFCFVSILTLMLCVYTNVYTYMHKVEGNALCCSASLFNSMFSRPFRWP